MEDYKYIPNRQEPQFHSEKNVVKIQWWRRSYRVLANSSDKSIFLVRKEIGDFEPGEFSLCLKFQMLLGIGLFTR